jgi:hypothetical protein
LDQQQRGPAPLARRRQAAGLALATVLLLATVLGATGSHAGLQALSLGLALPGGGFLAWVDASAPLAGLAPYLAAGSLLLFLLSAFLWFATGNVVLPALVWLAVTVISAGVPALCPDYFPPERQTAAGWLPAGMLGAFALLSAIAILTKRQRADWRLSFEAAQPGYSRAQVLAAAAQQPDEIGIEDLQRMRLVLDRALQPIANFDGFEWIDQFQTAAVRYQINFISYALAIASRSKLPDFDGYMLTAQRNLAAKQRDHRVWRYWELENLWGNLAAGRDPIARDNIMFSGFLAAQLAFARSGVRLTDYDADDSLRFDHPCGASFRYSLPDISERLARRYETAPFGLLACEPNWIYPLCNIMTASSIRASDHQFGTQYWDGMAAPFRNALERDFTSADGRLLAFRSSLTGLGSSVVGGVMMQAFPCLFLNTILPDVAARQWLRVRLDLTERSQRLHLWPLDVGNYRLTRASSLALTAAAAVEMGDAEIASRLLDALGRDCPALVADGIAHRPGVSVLAHAAEVMARLGGPDVLRAIVEKPRSAVRNGPCIKDVRYPEVLVAAARAEGGALRAVLYPGVQPSYQPVTLAGLKPSRRYILDIGDTYEFDADAGGEATVQVPLYARTELRIHPAA